MIASLRCQVDLVDFGNIDHAGAPEIADSHLPGANFHCQAGPPDREPCRREDEKNDKCDLDPEIKATLRSVSYYPGTDADKHDRKSYHADHADTTVGTEGVSCPGPIYRVPTREF